MRGSLLVLLVLGGCVSGSDTVSDTSDEGDPTPCAESLWFRDADGDGYGDPENTTRACDAAPGLVGNGNDCDDGDALVRDGVVWWHDRDGDGFGDVRSPVEACAAPDLAVGNDLDCDDADGDVWPGAEERCNGLDDDCSGEADGPDATDARAYYEDADGDGLAAIGSTSSVKACAAPDGYAERRDDCDDSDPEIGAAIPWYTDVDGDGFGTDASRVACEGGAGEAAAGGDCDDAEAAISPGAPELCNTIDDDCDGLADEPFADADFDVGADGLSLNGDAALVWAGADGALVLTDGVGDTSSAYLTSPVAVSAWYASLRFEASGGNGGEGLAFVFLDASDPALLGDDEDGLGVEGATGWAVVLDTYRNNGLETRDNWLSIRQASNLGVLAIGGTIPAVHDGGEQLLEVWFDAGAVTVAIDGVTYLTTTLEGPFPAAWQLGVTAATSSHYDTHAVDDLLITCPP